MRRNIARFATTHTRPLSTHSRLGITSAHDLLHQPHVTLHKPSTTCQICKMPARDNASHAGLLYISAGDGAALNEVGLAGLAHSVAITTAEPDVFGPPKMPGRFMAGRSGSRPQMACSVLSLMPAKVGELSVTEDMPTEVADDVRGVCGDLQVQQRNICGWAGDRSGHIRNRSGP